MNTVFTIFCVLAIAILASCDVRSGIAKKNMEKYTLTPTQIPGILPTPAGTPIAPADIVEVDVNLDGDLIPINGYGQNKTTACTKFNRVMVNGDANKVTIKGVCRQIMINGDKNEITADAAMEFVFNGSENIVRYSRFPNGKRPSVIENRAGNIVERISPGATNGQSRNKSL